MPELADLKASYIFVIRFLSSRMMDPHLYFETKYTTLVWRAESKEELDELMHDLLVWIQSSGLSSEELLRLDEALEREGLCPLPKYST